MKTLPADNPPFLSLAAFSDRRNFVRSFDRFLDSFVECHPGYSVIQPALLPLIVPSSIARSIWRTTQDCLQALKQVPINRFSEDFLALMEVLGYSRSDRHWLQTMTNPNGINLATAFARADFVISKDGVRLVEVNVGPTIGGIGILDRYADIFEVASRAFLDSGLRGRIVMPRPTQTLARCLQACFAANGSVRNHRLRIALVVADDEATVPHPFEAADYLKPEGIDAEVVRTCDISFKGRHVECLGKPVDIIYGCFTFDQMGEQQYRHFVEDAMACRREGGPLYIAPPVFTLFGNKGMLTYIDEMRPSHVTPCLAKSYRLEDQASRAVDHQEGLVLKPRIGLGGKGVMIGRDCTPKQWIQAIETALTVPHQYVLQEYIAPMPIELPTSRGMIPYQIGIGCLALCGQFGGFLVRQAPAISGGVINCKQGATFAGACMVDDSYLAAIGERP